MAVVGVASPISDGRGGSQDKRKNRYYRRTFVVQVDAAHDGPQTVLSAPFLPNIGDQYQTNTENDPTSFCSSRTPKAIARLVWHVDCDYEPTPPEDTNRPEISFRFEKLRVPVIGVRDQSFSIGDLLAVPPKAPHNQGLVNSFGDPFDPPVEYETSRPVVTITRFEPFINSIVLMEYQDAVNDANWAGALPRQARILDISGVKEWRLLNNVQIPRWKVTYQIAFNKDTWDLRVLDAGYRYKADANDVTGTPFEDVSGNRTIGLLDGDSVNGFAGGRKTAGQAPYFIAKEVYAKKSFAALNLPQDFNI